ncbi:type II toxin-antitoxin system VapC family toxin [Promicromonospora sp. Populi]|uniref:type II toxin-antitoxin system VapC family toxin n=1 Tax=Promicromonospora sp. Populi TaxID=3239420 RepID=UPI0034E26D0E
MKQTKKKPTLLPGTFVLDSEGLSKAVAHDDAVIDLLAVAHRHDIDVVISSATLVEAVHPKINRKALEWRLSMLSIDPVTEQTARLATELLADAGKHGHSHAIDAMVCATAVASPRPVRILTSDPDDIMALAGDHVSVIPV